MSVVDDCVHLILCTYHCIISQLYMVIHTLDTYSYLVSQPFPGSSGFWSNHSPSSHDCYLCVHFSLKPGAVESPALLTKAVLWMALLLNLAHF